MKNRFGAIASIVLLAIISPLLVYNAAGQPPKKHASSTVAAVKSRGPSGPQAPLFRNDITVVTGDVDGAGTDARVFITLYGNQKTSVETELAGSTGNCFERNQWDDFVITGQYGTIDSIRIRHDNSNSRPGWYLFCVRVKHSDTGLEDVFMPDRWLATDENDKKIDIISRRTNLKSITLTPPYARTYEAKTSPGAASAWTRAYKSNGWFNFYADAFVGGSVAEAGHYAEFYTNGVYNVAVRSTIIYVGGPINFGIASFSDLRTSVNLNGNPKYTDLNPPFSGSGIYDKIKKVIALTDDTPNPQGTFDEFTARMNEGKSYAKLSSAFNTLEQSSDAKRLDLCEIGRTVSGNNWVCSSIRTNTSAVLTGSSVSIVAGIVKSVEVIGIPQ